MYIGYPLGRIGRRRRRACAAAASEKLIAQLERMEPGEKCFVRVTSAKQLSAFGSRPLSPPLIDQIGKFSDRLRRQIWAECKNGVSIAVEHKVTDGRLASLVVTATKAN